MSDFANNCLVCMWPVVDAASAVLVSNAGGNYLVHGACFICSRCGVSLAVDTAVISDDNALLCPNDHFSR
jgi:hypothetical protein